MKYNFKGFTEKSNEALNKSVTIAETLGHTYIGSEHILLGLLSVKDSIACEVLNSNNIDFNGVLRVIKEEIGIGSRTRLSPEYFTVRANNVIESAILGAKSIGERYVSTEHILISLLGEADNYATRFLKELGINTEDIIVQIAKKCNFDTKDNDNTKKDNTKKQKTENLSKFGRDLTGFAKDGKIDPVIGRDKEIERVIQILCRRTKNNPCLIGEPGVGKTAIVEGLAQKIVSGDVPELLLNKKVFSLDLAGMVAGTKYRGDFEERIKAVIDEVLNNDDIIIFIDEVHTIMGAGAGEGSTDAANILKPSLARGDFQLIGATTISEYRKNIEKDAALERRFQPVDVAEPTVEDSILILKGLRPKYEEFHKVTITDEAIESAVKLSARYINDRFLPDKAIDLIDEAGSKIRLNSTKAPNEFMQIEEQIDKKEDEKEKAINSQDFEKAAKLRDEVKDLKNKLKGQKDDWRSSNNFKTKIMASDIADIVSNITGVPITNLTKEESERLLTLEEELHNRIIGQSEAVTAVAKAIRRGRVGLKDPKRPIGSFIFLGPTGVGKTELSRALSQSMFGSEDMMIKLDMSEYMEKHTVSRLIGSPPGYVGFDEGGQLTEKVRRKPYSVILFDEIEKAHPDVFNILLQILEDGVLTDSQGRKVDFKNTVIIMTSNIGARQITEKRISFGFTESNDQENGDVKPKVLEELKSAFRPEFLDRVDDIIVFNKLTKEEIRQITENMLNNLKERLSALDISVEFSAEVIDKLADSGYDPVYGARPLRRTIQTEIEDRLSEKILDGSIVKGQTAHIKLNNGEYDFG
ncbi:MAG: ATP-dependent Clp protease ATP-binding subunit [Clostridia bacterium]|nr:ATP-dependent Clp protease ATP-binding subunit [Clostridia bacterium]